MTITTGKLLELGKLFLIFALIVELGAATLVANWFKDQFKEATTATIYSKNDCVVVIGNNGTSEICEDK